MAVVICDTTKQTFLHDEKYHIYLAINNSVYYNHFLMSLNGVVPPSELQDTLFLLPPRTPQEYYFFHDESGDYVKDKGGKWLIHGVTIIPKLKLDNVYSKLMEERNNLNYHDEIHFLEMRNALRGNKAKCASAWTKLALNNFSEYCYYYYLAIDTKSPAFRHDQFPKPYYVYNYYAKTAIVGAIAWCFKDKKEVSIKIFSDGKRRPSGDNFSTYLPAQVVKSIDKKRLRAPDRYPVISLLSDVVSLVISDPRKCPADLKKECEVIQLTDLFTSNINQVLTAKSIANVKINLAIELSKWIDDTRKPPWLQNKSLHRILNLSCYPDDNGNYYEPYLDIKKVDQYHLPHIDDEDVNT